MKHSLDRSRSKHRPLAFQTLEPRLLLSADLAPAAAPLAHDALPPVPAEHRALEALADTPRIVMTPAASARELVFVDASLPDYPRLVADVLRATGGERPVEVIRLDPARDGVAQIGEALATRSALDAVHLVTHGGDGRVQLGAATLDAAGLERSRDAIAAWSRAFAAEGDLLLYGCDVAATAQGRAFIDALARLTGADVAASDDPTGAARLGGDWDLERTAGTIDLATAPLAGTGAGSWAHVLAADLLDWDAVALAGTWTAGDLAPGALATQNGGSITFTVTGETALITANATPAVTTQYDGGTGENTLQLQSNGFDPSVPQTVTVTIDFSAFAGGVSNLSFSIFDVDSGGGGTGFIDRVTVTSNQGNPTALVDSAYNDVVGANAIAGNNTSNSGGSEPFGNATFTFAQSGITTITIVYSNDGQVSGQGVGLHDLSFQTNNPPAGTNGTVAMNEDATRTFVAADFGFTDPDAGDTLGAVRIDSTPGAGSLVLVGSGAVAAGQVITVADIGAGNLRFTPAANANGSPYASFTFSVRDSAGAFDASPNTLTINVSAVNDAPVFGALANQTVAEDAGAQTVASFTTVAPGGGADEAGQTFSYTVSNDNNALFAVQPAIAADGTLTYTVAPNAVGSAIVTAFVTDSGGTAGGGVDTTGPRTFTIAVTPVNDEPSFTTAGNQTVLEDAGAQTVAAFATAAPGGGADEAGQTFSYTVSNDNNALFAVQPAIAANGTLTYTAAPNASGTAAVSVFLTDSGGTAGGGDDTSPTLSFTIGVTAVNDAPVASGAATLGAVLEDAASPPGATVSALLGANYSDATDGAAASALAGIAIVGNAATAAQGVWQYSPDGLAWTAIGTGLSDTAAVTLPATHLLRFLPAANFNGVPGALSVRLADGSAGAIATASGVNLGAAIGGTGHWSAATVALGTSITAVNDAPTFAALANQTVAEDAGAQTVASFTTVAPGGGADEAGQTFSYTVSNDNNALFAVQPAIAADGTLTYTVAPNAVGSAIVTAFVTDSGGTAGGGADTTGPRTFTVTATPVADTPSVTNAATLEDAQSAGGLVITRNPADGTEVTHFKITAISGGTLYLNDGTTVVTNGTFITVAQGAPGLKFTPSLHSTANGSFDVQASTASNDTGLGGAVVTATIAVTPVNDEPSFTTAGNQTVLEDAGAQTAAAFATAAPGGGADEAGQTFSYTVSNDNNALFAVQPAIAANGTLTYTAAPNASGTATVSVFLTDSGGTAGGGDDTSPTLTFTIGVTPVADTPTLTVAPAAGDEDTAIGLTIARALVDTDGSETLALTVAAIPVGATLADGVNAFTASAGSQSVAVTSWNLAQLRLTPPLHGDADFALLVAATATETANGATATANANLAVTVNAIADTPTLTVNPASGNEDTAIPLAVAAALVDGDGSEALAVTVSGIPVGATLSDGTSAFTATAGSQSVAVTGWTLALLRVTPPADADADFTLTIAATATEGAGGAAATASANLAVDVVPVNDAPTVAAPAAIGVTEDVASALTGIAFADVDAGAAAVTATFTVPQGTLTAVSGAGVVAGGTPTALTLTGSAADLDAFIAAGRLAYTTALDAVTPVTLGVAVNDLGNTGLGGPLGSGTSLVTLNVTPVNDAPVLGAVTLAIDPLQTVTLSAANLSATDVDDAAPSLVFLVAGVANGRFELAAAPGVAVTSFTQAQVAAGAVRFVHTSPELGPSFSVFVSDGAAIAGPGVAVISYRAPGADSPPPKRIESTPAPIPAESAALATARGGFGEPAASDFLRAPFAPSATVAVSFAEAPVEPVVALARPVRGGALLDPRSSGASGPGFVEADPIPTGAPRLDFAVTPVRHDDATAVVDLTFGSARITGMALSVGAVWWAARAGGLLASMLASTPAWRHIDPLPVLGRDESEPEIDWDLPEKRPPDEDASVAEVFGDGKDAANDAVNQT